MSIILIIVIVIAAIIVLLLITAAVAPKKYSIARQIDVDAPQQKVFDYIKMLKNQNHYNKWVMTDPEMKKEFTGNDGTVGFIYAWNGNKQAGEGEQEIKTLTNERVVSEVRFVRPFVSTSILEMKATALPNNRTHIDFSTGSEMKFPMNAMLPMIKKMLGKDMDITLANLKAIMEQ